MSIWDELGRVFTAPNLLAGAIIGGATIYSANKAAEANTQAAKIAAQSAKANAAAIEAGNRAAQERFLTMQAQAAPGVDRLRTNATASPEQLTPMQQQQLEDLRRTTGNQLSQSGLRGSGRAVTSAFRRIESDFVNRALEANRARGDQAATALASPYFSTGGQAATTDASTGRAIGESMMTAGLTQGQAGINNAVISGQALGDIAGVIATDIKGRESRYRDRTEDFRKKVGTSANETVSSLGS